MIEVGVNKFDCITVNKLHLWHSFGFQYFIVFCGKFSECFPVISPDFSGDF